MNRQKLEIVLIFLLYASAIIAVGQWGSDGTFNSVFLLGTPITGILVIISCARYAPWRTAAALIVLASEFLIVFVCYVLWGYTSFTGASIIAVVLTLTAWPTYIKVLRGGIYDDDREYTRKSKVVPIHTGQKLDPDGIEAALLKWAHWILSLVGSREKQSTSKSRVPAREYRTTRY